MRYMVYMKYILNIFNGSVVSVVWEIIQMNFDVICNYRVFNMDVWGAVYK